MQPNSKKILDQFKKFKIEKEISLHISLVKKALDLILDDYTNIRITSIVKDNSEYELNKATSYITAFYLKENISNIEKSNNWIELTFNSSNKDLILYESIVSIGFTEKTDDGDASYIVYSVDPEFEDFLCK